MTKHLHKKRYETFRVLLRESRVQVGVRQVELAKTLRTTQSFVSKSELGERRMDVIDLIDFLAGLGVAPTDFVEELVQRLEPRSPIAKPKRASRPATKVRA